MLPHWIFRQTRVGKNGKLFTLYKIRTMVLNPNVQFATPEVYTRFGRFLRKTKIDELAQIINVLKGDLNLVGPRSNVQEYWDIAPDHLKRKILSRKPGLTSLASIHFHDEESLIQQGANNSYDYYSRIKPMKILLDVFYVQHRDPFLKIWIIWRTGLIVLKSFFK